MQRIQWPEQKISANSETTIKPLYTGHHRATQRKHVHYEDSIETLKKCLQWRMRAARGFTSQRKTGLNLGFGKIKKHQYSVWKTIPQNLRNGGNV